MKLLLIELFGMTDSLNRIESYVYRNYLIITLQYFINIHIEFLLNTFLLLNLIT